MILDELEYSSTLEKKSFKELQIQEFPSPSPSINFDEYMSWIFFLK